MVLQDIFYIAATTCFIFITIFIILTGYYIYKINILINQMTESTKTTVKKIGLAGDLLKAGILKLFLSSMRSKGGDSNEK